MLDKLYITPKQWLRILRWGLYSLLFLLAMLTESSVFGRHALLGVCPQLVGVVVVCVCFREGPERGGLFALLATLFWCLSGASYGSLNIAVFTILPVAGTLFTRNTLMNRFVPCLLTALSALAAQQLVIFAIGYFLNDVSLLYFFVELLPCIAVSLLFQPPVYWLASRICRIGGPYESV